MCHSSIGRGHERPHHKRGSKEPRKIIYLRNKGQRKTKVFIWGWPHLVKVPNAKPYLLSSIPGTTWWKERTDFYHLFSDFHNHVHPKYRHTLTCQPNVNKMQ